MAPRAAGWMLICGLIGGFAPLAHAAQDLGRVQQEIRRLEGQRAAATDRRGQLMGELRLAEKKIGDVTAQLHALNDQLERKRDKLRLLRPRFEQQLRAVAREREALARQLRSAFVMGRQHRLKILLNQQDPLLVNRMMGYYGYISKARIERIASLRTKMAELERTEREIARGEDQLLELQKHAERERARLEQARGSRHELVDQLDGDIQGTEERLAQLRSQQERLTALVDRLGEEPPPAPKVATGMDTPKPERREQRPDKGTIQRRAVPAQASRPRPEQKPAAIQRKIGSTGFASGRGRLAWPLRGRLQAEFGSRNAAGLAREGVLIEAEPGAEVRAIHAGQVVFAEWMRGLGLLMIVDHGDGYMSLYGHNQGFLREVGDRVEAGEPIALVGDSGGRRSAALYFAIRRKSTPINPLQWCRRPAGKQVG